MLVHSNMGSLPESDVKYYKKEAAKVGKDFDYVFIAMDVPLGMPKSAR
jgi:transposase